MHQEQPDSEIIYTNKITAPTSSEIDVDQKYKYKKPILIITIASIVIYIFAIYLNFYPLCNGDMGCIVLAPIYILMSPLYPGIIHIISITSTTEAIIESPSIFKFYAFFILFINTLLASGLFASIFVYRNNKEQNINTSTGHKIGKFLLYSLSSLLSLVYIPPIILLLLILIIVYIKNSKLKNFKRDFLYVNKKTFFYIFIFFILFSIFHLIKNPPPPFTSDREIILFCDKEQYLFDRFNQCMPSYISSVIPNCSQEKSLFLYPYVKNIKKPDACSMSNISSKKIFSNIEFSGYSNESVSGYLNFSTSNKGFCIQQLLTYPETVPGNELGISYSSETGFMPDENTINRIFIFYSDVLKKSSTEQIESFCSIFSPKEDLKD